MSKKFLELISDSYDSARNEGREKDLSRILLKEIQKEQNKGEKCMARRRRTDIDLSLIGVIFLLLIIFLILYFSGYIHIGG